MKTLCILVAALAFASASLAQSPPENTIYQRLATKGDDSVTALKEVLAKSESCSAVLLYTASGVALREKRLEDSGYLFYVARFRAQFDKDMFPPTETGGDSPMVLFGALQQQLGSVVNPALMAEPKVFAKVLSRVKSWSPEVTGTYNPGWAFSEKRSKERAKEALQNGRMRFQEEMEGLCTLLQDETYFAAFRTAQNFNLRHGSERPSNEELDSAMATMERIETEKGIQGIVSKTKK